MKRENNISTIGCTINKELSCLNKKKTQGLIVFSTSCGVILDFKGLITHEGRKIIENSLIELIELNSFDSLKYVIYDNACNLYGYAKNHNLRQLLNINFLLDRFHYKNYKRKVCKDHSCYNRKELEKLNTQKCEQLFSLLKKFKEITKHMNKIHYDYFYLFLFDSLNERVIDKIIKENQNLTEQST